MRSYVNAVVGLVAAGVAALPAPDPTAPAIIPKPASCFLDTTRTPCFSYTTALPPKNACPTYSCPAMNPSLVCPLYIVVTTTKVPCHDPCCPTTPTVTAWTAPCPTCPDPNACHIPTKTVTATTGCAEVTPLTTA